MRKWDDIEPGTLTDSQLMELCATCLVVRNCDSKFVRQTCYELRVGEFAWYTYRRAPETRRVSTTEQGGVYLPSKGYATIITLEELELPADCIGRIMTKGQLFSIGVSAVNTYVDPGFSGPLGITLINHSSRAIFIPVGEPIAKIEFVKLGAAVMQPYAGPHLRAGSLWPVPDSYQNIPPSIDPGRYPEELKDPATCEIEREIGLIRDELTAKTSTIRALLIILIPLILSSILYWISDWASMSSAARVLVVTASSVLAVLAAVTKWWQSLSRFARRL